MPSKRHTNKGKKSVTISLTNSQLNRCLELERQLQAKKELRATSKCPTIETLPHPFIYQAEESPQEREERLQKLFLSMARRAELVQRKVQLVEHAAQVQTKLQQLEKNLVSFSIMWQIPVSVSLVWAVLNIL